MLFGATDFERGLFLLAMSVGCLVLGHLFRKWPEKVQDCSLLLDGSSFFLGEEAHRRLVRLSGSILTIASYGTLVPAAILL